MVQSSAFAAANDHLKVRFDPPPQYALEWLVDFYGIDLMPRPIRQRSGHEVLVVDNDLYVLGGVSSALSLMEDLKETRYSVIKVPEGEVRTFISTGEPFPFVHLPET